MVHLCQKHSRLTVLRDFQLAYDYVSLRKEVEPEEATLGGSLHSPSATSHEHEKAAPGVATAAAKEQ